MGDERFIMFSLPNLKLLRMIMIKCDDIYDRPLGFDFVPSSTRIHTNIENVFAAPLSIQFSVAFCCHLTIVPVEKRIPLATPKIQELASSGILLSGHSFVH